jgi:hypothetical protein
MDASEFDVGGEVPADRLEQLHAALNEIIALETLVAQMEEDLRMTKAALYKAANYTVPDLMGELQLEQLSFKGFNVKVSEFVTGSLPKDPEKRAAGIKWLEAHDGAGLIKTEISLAFAKSQHNEALSIVGKLQEEGYAPLVESGVHASTLKAYARQRIRDGDDIDPETLGLFVGKVAVLKELKK